MKILTICEYDKSMLIWINLQLNVDEMEKLFVSMTIHPLRLSTPTRNFNNLQKESRISQYCIKSNSINNQKWFISKSLTQHFSTNVHNMNNLTSSCMTMIQSLRCTVKKFANQEKNWREGLYKIITKLIMQYHTIRKVTERTKQNNY